MTDVVPPVAPPETRTAQRVSVSMDRFWHTGWGLHDRVGFLFLADDGQQAWTLLPPHAYDRIVFLPSSEKQA